MQAAIEVWHKVNAGFYFSGNVDKSRQRTWDEQKSEAAIVKLLDENNQISRARLLAATYIERVVFHCKRYLLPHPGRF